MVQLSLFKICQMFQKQFHIYRKEVFDINKSLIFIQKISQPTLSSTTSCIYSIIKSYKKKSCICSIKIESIYRINILFTSCH